MNVDDYQQEAMSLLNPALNPQDVLENALMGLCGESGEAIDLLIKHRFQGHPREKENLKKHLADPPPAAHAPPRAGNGGTSRSPLGGCAG